MIKLGKKRLKKNNTSQHDKLVDHVIKVKSTCVNPLNLQPWSRDQNNSIKKTKKIITNLIFYKMNDEI